MTDPMTDTDFLAQQFESNRKHLRAVAYRMLGSLNEADDAVQEAWLRLARADTTAVENLTAWLTTIVGRVCLDMLRRRRKRPEDLVGVHIPDPIVAPADDPGPEQQALFADSVGLALLVVLQQLDPAERLAFVLHDMFGVGFDEIATIVDRRPAAARQLASRARRRVQGTPEPEPDLALQREVVEAFLTASRNADFDALVVILDPDVVLRTDYGTIPSNLPRLLHGAAAVAKQALLFAKFAQHADVALINGNYGLVTAPYDRPYAILGITVTGGKIVALDILADQDRLRGMDIDL